MLVKKFSLSKGALEELQLEDLSEELYSISLCQAAGHQGLTVGGERGIVQHIQLDSESNLKLDSTKILHDLGSPVNSLSWTANGRYLVIAGATNSVFVHDIESKSTTECKGVQISSEGLYACISPDDKHFAVSFKDGTVVIGEFDSKSITHKVQIGDIVKGSNLMNQICFDQEGNLYAPGRRHIQKCLKSQDYKITELSDLTFTS